MLSNQIISRHCVIPQLSHIQRMLQKYVLAILTTILILFLCGKNLLNCRSPFHYHMYHIKKIFQTTVVLCIKSIIDLKCILKLVMTMLLVFISNLCDILFPEHVVFFPLSLSEIQAVGHYILGLLTPLLPGTSLFLPIYGRGMCHILGSR